MIINIHGKIGSGKDTIGNIIQHLIAWSKYPVKDNYIDDVLLSLNNSLNNINNGWEIKKWADKLKDIVCLLIGCTREQLEDREFRDIPLGEEWDKWEINYSSWDNGNSINFQNFYTSKEEAINFYSYLKENYSKYDVSPLIFTQLTPRILMQLLGTEAGRDIIHPNIWVNSLMSEYKPKGEMIGKYPNPLSVKYTQNFPNWIITDNRFPNETKRVKKERGITIKIERNFNLRHPDYNSLEEVKDKNTELYKQLIHYSETALDDYNEWDYIIHNNGTIEELIEQIKQILEKENII
jgi:hypothetical protein